MLTEREIQNALHASRVMPVGVPNPHGPLGLEQLAAAVAQATVVESARAASRIERTLKLPVATWAKLDGIAQQATKAGSRRLSASDVAAALIERAVAAD